MTDHHTTRRTQVQEALRQKTRSVPNFPAPGVIFEDLTPVLADAEALRLLVDDLAAAATTMRAELISGLDARGFLLASAVAYKLGLGLLTIRKKGKLPPPVITKEYALEYGSAALELPRNGIDLTGKKNRPHRRRARNRRHPPRSPRPHHRHGRHSSRLRRRPRSHRPRRARPTPRRPTLRR